MPNPDASEIVSSMGLPSDGAETGAETGHEASEHVSNAHEASEQEQSQDQAPEQELDYARGFAALTRKERMLASREQQIKDQMGKVQAYEQDRELLKSDPVAFLEKQGLSFDELANFVLNDRKKTPETQFSEMQKRIDQLEAERKKEREEFEQKQKSEKYNKAQENFKGEIKEFISSKGEEFELVKEFGEIDTVYDVIESYYNQHGTILEIGQAAAQVEKYLEEQMEKAAKTSKFKSRYAMQNSSEDKKDDFPPRDQSHRSSAITNDVVANTPSPSAEKSYLSHEDSIRRSAEMLQQQWLKNKGYRKE